MASRWKIVRLGPFKKEYELPDKNIISVGRGMENDITCQSIFVSRRHCMLIVEDDGLVYVKDLKSSNGTFIGTKKILPEEKSLVNVDEEIGLGVTMGKLDVQNEEDRFIFQLVCTVKLEVVKCESERSDPSLKRKAESSCISAKENPMSQLHSDSILDLQFIEPEVIDLVSDDDSESDMIFNLKPSSAKKLKLDKSTECAARCSDIDCKVEKYILNTDSGVENMELPFDIMQVKEEYRDDLDDPIYLDSDSDSDMWMMRLSQSSPGKPFMKVEPASKLVNNCGREATEAPVKLLQSESQHEVSLSTAKLHGFSPCVTRVTNKEDLPDLERQLFFLHEGMPDHSFVRDINPVESPQVLNQKGKTKKKIDMLLDVLDGTHTSCQIDIKTPGNKSPTTLPQQQRKLIIIEDVLKKNDKKQYVEDKEKKIVENKLKSSIKKHMEVSRRKGNHSSSRRSSSSSYKEERKQKLKEIAQKHLSDLENLSDIPSKVVITKVNAKVTSSNRGEFLTISTPKPRSRSSSHPAQSAKQDKVHERSNTGEVLIEANARKTKVVLAEIKDLSDLSKKKIDIKLKTLKEKPVKVASFDDCLKKDNSTSSQKAAKDHCSKSTTSGKHVENNTEERTKSRSRTSLKDGKSAALKDQSSKSVPKHKSSKKDSRTKNTSNNLSIPEDTKNKTTYKDASGLNVPKDPRVQTVSQDHIKSNLSNNIISTIVSKNCNESVISKDQIETSIPKDPRIPNTTTETDSNTKTKSSSFSYKSCIQPLTPLTSASSKVKHKKRVTFSSKEPEVIIFEIAPGNKLEKTSLCKHYLYNLQPVFSLEQRFLMKILHWSPKWLEEQQKTKDPPPILTNNRQPEQLRHSFVAHQQYVSIIGDLLLMEVWEYLTQTYMKKKVAPCFLNLVLECVPPNPGGKSNGFVSMSVNLSLPKVESKSVPRYGELMKIDIGPTKDNNCMFAFVQNVRSLPAPIHNKNAFFSITLNILFCEIMERMRPGEALLGTSLSFIRNELMLVQAIEELRGSPLQEVILHPHPQHFARNRMSPDKIKPTPWTNQLNSSQKEAVEATVQAAFGDQPLLQMIQGPPGTGKSSVICSMVLRYFYNDESRKCKERHKLLICATSNAAVDEIVVRLLNLRQNFPKDQRLRMVRVGRLESMHPRAAAISSQTLAKNFVTQVQTSTVQTEEMSYLQSKVNSWRLGAESASEAARVAYCAERARHFAERLARVKEGLSSRASGAPDGLPAAEARVLEGADVVITTLASCANMKLRCLKGQIALCIIDEAGQAIEPEILIPLMLAVTKIALIGDPQQLPGYICSQRAKQYGLSESLFSRISQCAEEWPNNPVILLNQQYRMHPAIAHFPNKAFYNGQVQDSAMLQPHFIVPPYRLLYISSGDKGQGSSGVNEMEAWGVSRLVFELGCQARERNMSIGVITPYNSHKDMIRSCLNNLHEGAPTPLIEVNTIDSFQGQERDIVVLSLARSQGLGFLADPGRMTVALTRAKHCLVICLNPQAMMKNGLWRSLIDDGNQRGVSKYLPSQFCRPSTPQQAAQQSVLQYLN